ncbi:MAG: hypothetical protein DSZ30_00140 [Aquificaceae bacterium]|nr:MAG: hypothetical protein DSZ30_00140 [Aquificaceae bacterium]
MIFCKHYPFEAHFVHSDRKGNLAVVVVFFKLGKKNPYLEKILHYTPTRVGEKRFLTSKVNPSLLLLWRCLKDNSKGLRRFSAFPITAPCNR